MFAAGAQVARSRWLLVGILALFIISASLTLSRYYFIQPDSAYLLALGKNIAGGNGLTINNGPHWRYPPAYPALAGWLYLLLGDLEAAGHLVSVLSGVLTIALVYTLTARKYDRRTALIAALLLALNPLFVWICTAATAEGFYALAYASFILVMLALLSRPSWWAALSAGLVAAVAYLTRAEGFLFLPLGFVTLLVAWWRGRRGWAASSAALALFLAGWLALAFPYMLFLRENLGGWTVSGKITQNIERVSEAIYTGDERQLREQPFWMHESPGLLPYLVGNFPRVAERYIGFTLAALKQAISEAWPILLLFIWFCVLGLRDGTTRGWHLLWFASPLVIYPLAHIEIRYVTPTFVALAPLIAWGMSRAWSPLREADRMVRLRRGLVILTIVILMVGNGLYVRKIPEAPTEQKALAEWMLKNLPDARSARISAQFPYVNFYTGNEDFRYLPWTDTLAEGLSLARSRHLDYLVIDRRTIPIARPYLAGLLDPSSIPPGVELVKTLTPPEVPQEILLYRVLGGEVDIEGEPVEVEWDSDADLAEREDYPRWPPRGEYAGRPSERESE
jgi:4-amino-4-deoxy-L-arabinose transferase-like glycosyltransferase